MKTTDNLLIPKPVHIYILPFNEEWKKNWTQHHIKVLRLFCRYLILVNTGWIIF